MFNQFYLIYFDCFNYHDAHLYLIRWFCQPLYFWFLFVTLFNNVAFYFLLFSIGSLVLWGLNVCVLNWYQKVYQCAFGCTWYALRVYLLVVFSIHRVYLHPLKKVLFCFIVFVDFLMFNIQVSHSLSDAAYNAFTNRIFH